MAEILFPLGIAVCLVWFVVALVVRRAETRKRIIRGWPRPSDAARPKPAPKRRAR